MRSGKSSHVDQQLPRDLRLSLSAGLLVFLDKSVDTAVEYKDHAGRLVTTPRDVILALKREVFEFGNRRDIEKEVDEVKNELRSLSSSDSDGNTTEFSSECSDVSSTSSGTDILLPVESETEDVHFTSSACKCTMCTDMNSIEEKWEKWVPETPLEKSLHRAIEAVSDRYFDRSEENSK